MKLSKNLQYRGFVNQTTYKSIGELDAGPITFYWGVDPSAPSMQVGNFAIAMMIRHFLNAGHKAVLLVGGATGMIGDPDGKSDERSLMSIEQIATNKEAIAAQYKQIFAGQDFKIVDNYDWFKDMGYLQFLRDVGKHVPIRQMLSREFVSSRLAADGSGISYAEFSYALIQGYDFVHLNKEHGVTLQVCGADQWGNSIAGVDLVRRISGQDAHVWSAPLVINKSTGKKFGKTEDGAIWLDPNLTNPYKFYQFWLNVDDIGVVEYLKIYTYLEPREIDNLATEVAQNPAGREAQKKLAECVTMIVHGQAVTDRIVQITDVLFGKENFETLPAQSIKDMADELMVVAFSDDIFELLVSAELASSKSQARQFVADGAVYVNGQKIDENYMFKDDKSTHGYFLLRRGKNNNVLISV